MITPTVGRVVWFTPHVTDDPRQDIKQPLVGLVTYVWNDRVINLATFDPDGNPLGGKSSVTLLQDDDAKPEDGYFASWMPYQKAVASGKIEPVLHEMAK